jgi:succinate dehydrogenase / fumarate reductase iron-sulfur subunit
MNFTLRVWRQKSGGDPGRMADYRAENIIPDMSFLEMLDIVNQDLIAKGEEPIAFDHDCREGICGMCGAVVNGVAHGPLPGTTLCQLYMRHFHDGETITIEPWRAAPFPVLRDLVVDRSALDRIMHAGGFVSVRTGAAPDANAILIPKKTADLAMDAAACIGCGACVAACPNASPMLFVAAKVSQLALLPQGQPEREARVRAMVAVMEREGFGGCTVHAECEGVCPKDIKLSFIGKLNWELIRASLHACL